jgi:hypothetical protein
MSKFAYSAPSRRHLLGGAVAAATASLTDILRAGPSFANGE